MRVMEIRGAWGLEHLQPGTRPDPSPGPSQVVVRIDAASVNYRDLVMVRRGLAGTCR
jgi:NADPH:quinone reductase-like Zn-dependent oxidoreductase